MKKIVFCAALACGFHASAMNDAAQLQLHQKLLTQRKAEVKSLEDKISILQDTLEFNESLRSMFHWQPRVYQEHLSKSDDSNLAEWALEQLCKHGKLETADKHLGLKSIRSYDAPLALFFANQPALLQPVDEENYEVFYGPYSQTLISDKGIFANSQHSFQKYTTHTNRHIIIPTSLLPLIGAQVRKILAEEIQSLEKDS